MDHKIIPDMPDWFRQYLESLSDFKKDELEVWLNDSGDGQAVMDTMTDALTY
jgi:hypothetical protein